MSKADLASAVKAGAGEPEDPAPGPAASTASIPLSIVADYLEGQGGAGPAGLVRALEWLDESGGYDLVGAAQEARDGLAADGRADMAEAIGAALGRLDRRQIEAIRREMGWHLNRSIVGTIRVDGVPRPAMEAMRSAGYDGNASGLSCGIGPRAGTVRIGWNGRTLGVYDAMTGQFEPESGPDPSGSG